MGGTVNRELTYDEASALGFDASGRDGDPRFPYHLSDAKAIPGHGRVRIPDCGTCVLIEREGFGPQHFASLACESGQRAHCTCDVCF